MRPQSLKVFNVYLVQSVAGALSYRDLSDAKLQSNIRLQPATTSKESCRSVF